MRISTLQLKITTAEQITNDFDGDVNTQRYVWTSLILIYSDCFVTVIKYHELSDPLSYDKIMLHVFLITAF